MKDHAMIAREKLFSRLNTHSAVVLFSGKAPHRTLDQYYLYTAQRNFFYLTNLAEPSMILFMLKGEKDTKTFLFIEENTDLIIKWEGARMTKEEAHERSQIPLENIFYLTDFEKMFNQAMNFARSLLGAPPKEIYLDLYHESFSVKPKALAEAKAILENYPELIVKNINEHLGYLRMFKTEDEIEEIKKAINHTKVGLDHVLTQIQKRDFEYQLFADFVHAITFDGSEGCAFDTIAASGKNATVLHYIKNNDHVKAGELILFDLGALHNNYAADISRTYPINGSFTDRQKELYSIVLTVNKETIDFVKPGITWKELNAFAKRRLIEETKRIGLIKEDEEISQYYYHSIGHFLGLDVHDVGLYDLPLQEGMVLTIEPGLYVSEEGIGIRIEDDILVTKEGSLNLSAAIPKEIDELESIIKRSK